MGYAPAFHAWVDPNVVLLAMLYPFMTAMWGWDPVYSVFKLRTGKASASCGTIDTTPPPRDGSAHER